MCNDRTLVLDHNPLTEVGIRVMCGAMRANFDLKSLSLMYCRIGPAGGKIIADTLIANSRVAELQLKGNQLEGEGILAISQALRRNKFLESLDLSDNCLRDMYGNEEKKRKEKEKTDKEGTSSSPSTPSAMSTNGASSPRSESEMSRSALNTAETGVDGDVDSLRDSTSAPSNVLAIDGNMVTIGASNDALAEGTVKALLTEDSNGVASSPLKKDTVAMLSIAVMLKHNTTLKKLNLSFNLIGHKSAQILKDTITSAKATSNLAEFIVTERLDSKLFQDLVKFESAKKGKKGAGGKKKKKK
uniref:Uncharacterized protein n=1 Tax=Palpitomonas bilix TaxID=652834 RepID=A0A7S3GLD5_9EUKA|mmetsp:Transcript_831/g.1538  ORF Transcript_831/g.1538 Transcript_831/m.1538 type:complete len:301 (+) Transcript_831:221-1123(+)